MKWISFLLTALVFAMPATAQTKQADSTTFATIVFYRPYIPPMNAPLKKVPIYINDTLAHSLKANTVFTQKISLEGKYRIAIDTEGETTIPLKIKFGKTYYFRCEVKAGLWFGKPVIGAVDPDVGSTECEVLEIRMAKKK